MANPEHCDRVNNTFAKTVMRQDGGAVCGIGHHLACNLDADV
ncbi:MAG: hypothetical protein V3R80_14475 [Candidatus Tectomicrobia bacterium]